MQGSLRSETASWLGSTISGSHLGPACQKAPRFGWSQQAQPARQAVHPVPDRQTFRPGLVARRFWRALPESAPRQAWHPGPSACSWQADSGALARLPLLVSLLHGPRGFPKPFVWWHPPTQGSTPGPCAICPKGAHSAGIRLAPRCWGVLLGIGARFFLLGGGDVLCPLSHLSAPDPDPSSGLQSQQNQHRCSREAQ